MLIDSWTASFVILAVTTTSSSSPGIAMSHTIGKSKTSPYKQRNLTSIPAPLELDSDPEFNAGTFVYEIKKRGKRAGKASETSPSTSPRKSRKRRSDILNDPGPSTSFKKRPRGAGAPKTNPLLEYFGGDLDLHSASEEDEPSEEALDEGVSESDSDKEVETEEPALSRTLSAFAKSSNGATPTTASGTPAVDSETESESEAEPVGQPLKRKSPSSPQPWPPAKRAKEPPSEEDSETESESEDELVKPARSAARVALPVVSDSETESEDEGDMIANPAFSPRPGFPLGPDQSYLGPFVLNREQGIMVPASVNTYLRPYQRDGVQFFWDLYHEGRGGLLGDDMGLVC
ncbi:hypothetical protein BDN67DRAFT_574330 [Paxillus ammoniavirescens]|nr:hypothetical protein BDN67DRAFT_574330 [Paxillus ammoniavirescens]